VTLTPPAVAETEMVAVPMATPRTSPELWSTVATLVADELHVTVAAIALPL
jgi:hypothetical protein